jgi:hypothetical protein
MGTLNTVNTTDAHQTPLPTTPLLFALYFKFNVNYT